MTCDPELSLQAVVAPVSWPVLARGPPCADPLQPPLFGRETGSEGSGDNDMGDPCSVPRD